MSWVLAITAAFLGLLIWMLAVPMKNGTIARNPLYGFRTPATLASDEVWYLANRLAGRLMVTAGKVTIAASPLVFFVPESARVVVLILVVQGPLFYAVARAFVGLRRIQRDIGSGR
jgi:uncharacterized membrane protein